MSGNVVPIPTRPVVDSAWADLIRLLLILQSNPTLKQNPEFSAHLADAESRYFNLYKKWAKSA